MGGSQHHTTEVITTGEGAAQARCACGWSSQPVGTDKHEGTMDAFQSARDAADLHEWEASLPES